MTSVGSPQSSLARGAGLARRSTHQLENGYRRTMPSGCYYPLSVGNRWQYASTDVLTVESGTDVTEGLEEEEVLAVHANDLGGASATIGHRLLIDGHDQAFQTRLRQNGQATADLETGTIYLQVPLLAGSGWSWTDDNGNLHLAEIAGLQTVQVPAGKFHDCVCVREVFKNRLGRVIGNRKDWYAPQVGRVKSLLIHEAIGQGTFEERRELVAFSLRHPGARSRSRGTRNMDRPAIRGLAIHI